MISASGFVEPSGSEARVGCSRLLVIAVVDSRFFTFGFAPAVVTILKVNQYCWCFVSRFAPKAIKVNNKYKQST